MQIGIDLGTTNSLCALFEADNTTVLVPNVHGELLTPSVIGISDDGEILVGKTAADRLVTHPDLTVAAFKRAMGTERVFSLGKERFRPEELSALLLRNLVRDAEEQSGEPVASAVISVPAYFNDTQRKATHLAAELAGLRVDRLINEPTAAALAYGLHDSDEESTFLVFDLGGGTFDVSVLELFDGVMEVHASAGDNFLGGEDFVDLLVGHFVRETEIELSIVERSQLRASAERAKRELNSSPSATLQLVRGDEPVSLKVTSDDFATLSKPLLDRLRRPVERALRDSRLSLDTLDEVVLVGGATRTRLVQQLVARMFGVLPLRTVNPDEVVARGAAVQAALVGRHEALEDVVMTDVCPYSLGIAVTQKVAPGQWVDGSFCPIIERNTIVPASRVDTFSPIHEDQTVIRVVIFQGESRRVENNIKLGEVEVEVPLGEEDERQVEVRFTYDSNGLLQVEATVLATGETSELVLTQNAKTMSPAEIKAALTRLDRLKIHPRDQDENRAVTNRALRLYEERLGFERELVGRLVDQWEAVLNRQDPIEIRSARQALVVQLDELE